MNISSSFRLLAGVLLATTVSTQAFARGDNDQGGKNDKNQGNQQAKQQQQQMKQAQQQQQQQQNQFKQAQQQQKQAQQQQKQAQQQQQQQQNQFKQAQQQQKQAQEQQRQQQRQQQDQMKQARDQQKQAEQQRDQVAQQQKAAQQQQKMNERQQKNARQNQLNDVRQAQNQRELDAKRNYSKDNKNDWNDGRRPNVVNVRPNTNNGQWRNGRWQGDRNHVRKVTNKRFKNWNDQRSYLNQNIRRMNEIARLNAIQQQQLDAQMRAAYLAYHNNNWNGAYDWNAYSDPQFIDYMEETRPSLLATIMGYLGLGNSGNVGYLNTNSSDWSSERNDFAQNMNRIHQLRLDGRISADQEQVLLSQLQAEFRAYHNNNWNGDNSWNQYNDPGFMDYLHNRKPSILNTIRGFLNR